MDLKHQYIFEKLQTEQNSIIKSDQYVKFFSNLVNHSIDERFEIMAKIAIQGANLGYDQTVISNCKLHLKSKAFSGITGSITEKNINFVYELITKY
jgi:hypothetical protein